MALLPVLEYPDPRLRERALPVEQFDAELGRLVEDLLETLHATRSIGLAAPQVDRQIRVLVTNPSGDAASGQVFVNPEIVAESGLAIVEESCLSVPGLVAKVLRATDVRVRAQDASGTHFERDLSGMDAVCLQHELDHLEGKLLVDRLSFFRRLKLRAREARAKRRAAAA